MAKFKVKSIDASGTAQTGEWEALDRKRLVALLNSKGLKPIRIETLAEEVDDDEAIETANFFADSSKKPSWFALKKSRDIISLEFLKRLHVLLSSGMSLGDAVNLMSRRLSDPNLQELCQNVWKFLSEGQTLAATLQRFPQYFSASTIHLIEAGEASGNLVPILDRIIAYLEETRDIKKRLVSSLTYPAFVLITALAVVIILLTVLLPKIKGILDQLGGDLPWISQALISSADATIKYGPFVLGGLFIGTVSFLQWRKTKAGKKKSDYWLLRFPIIGKIYLYSSIFTSTNLMATLLGSGINTTETLRLVERSINNTILRAKFAIARKQIQEGVSMAAAIQRVRYMPELAMDILSVGENTGNLVSSLLDINKIYRDELTKSLNKLMNTTVVVALGGSIILVALIAVSVVYSVLSVSQSIQM